MDCLPYGILAIIGLIMHIIRTKLISKRRYMAAVQRFNIGFLKWPKLPLIVRENEIIHALRK